MKPVKSLLVICALAAGMCTAQGQIGKLKSVAKTVTGDKKAAETPSAGSAVNNAAAEANLGKYSEIKPGMTNPSLEKQALEIVNKKATSEKWKEKYTVAKITSPDWEIVKNEYTGKIISRKIYMSLYGVWPDGKCKAVDFGFLQNYDGSQYQNTLQYNGIGDMTQVVCE